MSGYDGSCDGFYSHVDNFNDGNIDFMGSELEDNFV